MQIEKRISYIKYVIRELSFKEYEGELREELNVIDLELGYSQPKLSHIKDNNLAIIPLKFKLSSKEAFFLECRLDVGFNANDAGIKEINEFKNLVNDNKKYFTKYIQGAINSIILDTTKNTAYSLNEIFEVPTFSYDMNK
jgi:hypothetical protein|nr:MAG TPA: hypothetical protein [Caudoviricetes sp.]